MEHSIYSILLSFLTIYLSLLSVITLLGLVSYILRGIGLYTMGRQRGMDNAWLAFVPYARTYFQGELCGPVRIMNREMRSPGLWLVLLPIANGILTGGLTLLMYLGVFAGAVSSSLSNVRGRSAFSAAFAGGTGVILLLGLVMVLLVSLALGAARNALTALINYRIYGSYMTTTHSLLHAVLGLFIPLYTSILLFILRSKERKQPQ